MAAGHTTGSSKIVVGADLGAVAGEGDEGKTAEQAGSKKTSRRPDPRREYEGRLQNQRRQTHLRPRPAPRPTFPRAFETLPRAIFFCTGMGSLALIRLARTYPALVAAAAAIILLHRIGSINLLQATCRYHSFGGLGTWLLFHTTLGAWLLGHAQANLVALLRDVERGLALDKPDATTWRPAWKLNFAAVTEHVNVAEM